MPWIDPSEEDATTDTLEKRLGDSIAQFRAKLESGAASSRRGSRMEDPIAYQAEGVLYPPPNARYHQLLTLPESADIGGQVNEAMRDIEKHDPVLAGVLPKTYQLFGSTVLKELLKKIPDIVDFDFVLANPPINVNAVDKERLAADVGTSRRFPFGLPRTDNANGGADPTSGTPRGARSA